MYKKGIILSGFCIKLQRSLYNSINIIVENIILSLRDINSQFRLFTDHILARLNCVNYSILAYKIVGMNNILEKNSYYFSSMTVLSLMNDRNKLNNDVPSAMLVSQAINFAAKIRRKLPPVGRSVYAFNSQNIALDDPRKTEFVTLTTSSQVYA